MRTTSPTLQAYAAFLRQHHLRELAELNLRIAVELDVPLLKAFAHLPEEQLLQMTEAGLDRFLQDLEADRLIEASSANLKNWEADRLEGIGRDDIGPTDLVLVAGARKQALVGMLDRYAQTPGEAVAIALALEALDNRTQAEAFQVFTRLREAATERLARAEAEREAAVEYAEELQSLNEELQHQSEELQSGQEELETLYEALRTHNEAIEAEVAERTRTLREREALLSGIFEGLPGGIAIMDREFVYKAVNPSYTRVFGQRPEDFVGRSVFEVFPGTEALIGPLLGGVLDTGKPYTAYGFPFSFTSEEGTHDSYWDFTYAPIHDDRGAVTGVVVLCFEVTARVVLEREVADQQALNERIVENAPAGIAFLDSELVYRRINHAYAHLMGMAIDQVQDKSIYEVFPGATDQFESLMREVMETGVPYQTRNFPFKFMLDGEEKQTYWDFTYQPVPDKDGKTGILILEVEVSDRQEKERLQVEQIKQLKDLDRYKDQFLSVISHELRTPLNFIMGFASTLEDEVQGPMNPAQLEAVGKILNGADRMLVLVDDLLDFAKIQSGRFDLTPEPTPYAALVDEVIGLLKPLADQKALTITSSVPREAEVVLDPSRIGQVLTNLVSNAIKFTASGGTVRVNAYRNGDEVVTEVTDTGCGIAAEHHDKLFMHFQQLDMSNTRKAGGTGLGLAISKALVEAHGGIIGVESEPEAGSTFWFRLPAEPSEIR